MFDAPTLLPPNATKTERDLEQVIARMVQVPVPINTLWNVDACPEAMLPYLAWALSVDVWDASWPVEIKRNVLRDAVPMHRLKGTRASVERALGALGFDIDISEWFEHGGPVHTFRIDAFVADVLGAGFQVDAQLYATVTRLIEHTKPARSQFELRIGEVFAQSLTLRSATEASVTSVETHDFSARPVVAAAPLGARAGSLMQSTSALDHVFARRDQAGDVGRGAVANTNRSALIKRVEQLGAFTWSPITTGIGGARADYPDNIPVGAARTGPPYSSVKTRGFTIGQGISIETFLSAAANPDSVLYGIDLYDIAPSGRAYYGAVCSNFLAEGFMWPYSPTTSILSRDWADWGFAAEIKDFSEDDIEVGDVVVTDGGGHIELIVDVTHLKFTVFDQAYDGPDRAVWDRREFMAYAAGRGYKLLKFDFENADLTYQINPFSPIRGEFASAPPPNEVLLLQRGNKSNYAPSELARFNIMADDVQSLVVRKGAVTICEIKTGGGEIISKSFDTEGDYSAFCIRTDGTHSAAEQFKVASVVAQASASVIVPGVAVTVQFETMGCTATNLILESVSHNSISNGILREITADERVAGQMTFIHDRRGDYVIRIRAENEFGGVVNAPAWAMPLKVMRPSE